MRSSRSRTGGRANRGGCRPWRRQPPQTTVPSGLTALLPSLPEVSGTPAPFFLFVFAFYPPPPASTSPQEYLRSQAGTAGGGPAGPCRPGYPPPGRAAEGTPVPRRGGARSGSRGGGGPSLLLPASPPLLTPELHPPPPPPSLPGPEPRGSHPAPGEAGLPAALRPIGSP